MNMKVIIYRTNDTNPAYNLIVQFFELESIAIQIHQDLSSVMELSKGRVNPNGGFVVMIDDVACYSIYDVVHTIEQLYGRRL